MFFEFFSKMDKVVFIKMNLMENNNEIEVFFVICMKIEVWKRIMIIKFV